MRTGKLRTSGEFRPCSEWAVTPHVSDPTPLRYYEEDYLVLDFEIDTSHGDFGHPVHPANQMLLACWKFDGEMKSVWGNEFQLTELFADLDKCDFLIAHNAKYELGWLRRCGYDISKLLVFDTKIAEYVLFGNLKGNTSLNSCCIRRGIPQKDPVVDLMMTRGVNPVEIPKKWLEGRCRKDVADTETVFRSQRDSLACSGRLGVLYTRCIFTPVLADMEFSGMMLDQERVLQLVEETEAQEIALRNKLEEMVGGINMNSPKQLSEYLYKTLGFKPLRNAKGKEITTASGGSKTDQDTILKLKATTAEQKAFQQLYVEWTKLDSAMSKYLDFYRGVCLEHGGVFHAEFNQTVTKTHRLSSSGIKLPVTTRKGEVEMKGTQFQNQPREYKPMFKARREGWYFTEWDGSGLEFRVAGIAGDDEQIKADINDPDFDPHTRTASVMFSRDYADLRAAVVSGDKTAKSMRTDAKAHTFKPLYGGESGTEEQQRYYRSFKERYKGLAERQEEWLKLAYNHGVVVLPWGMRYYFPQLTMDRSGYIKGKTNVYNYPIQGLATAEIIPVAATYFWHAIRARGLQDKIIMVNTVHDSVLAEVHPDYLGEYKELVLWCWKYVYFYLQMVYNLKIEGIPLGTEITWGTHWGEGDSVAFNIWVDKIVESK